MFFAVFCLLFAINVIHFVNLVATSQKSTQSAGTSTNSNNPASLLKAKATSVGMILKPKRKSEYYVVNFYTLSIFMILLQYEKYNSF